MSSHSAAITAQARDTEDTVSRSKGLVRTLRRGVVVVAGVAEGEVEALGIAPGLADLPRLQLGQLVEVLADGGGDQPQQATTLPGGERRHCANAPRESATASATSSASPSTTRAISRPVAGSVTPKVARSPASTQRPPTNAPHGLSPMVSTPVMPAAPTSSPTPAGDSGTACCCTRGFPPRKAPIRSWAPHRRCAWSPPTRSPGHACR